MDEKKKKKQKFLTTDQVESRFNIIRTIVAAVVAILFCLVLIAISSDNVWADILTFIIGPFTRLDRFANCLVKMVPILFCSVALCLLFSANIINLAVEGGFFVGVIAAVAVASISGIPAGLHFILTALAGMAAASVVLLIPALLNQLFHSNVMVTSLMLNYACTFFCLYMIANPLRDPDAGSTATYKVASSAALPNFINIGAAQVHIGLIIGLAAAVVIWLIMYRTTLGYQIRTVGMNPGFAKYSGISVGKIIVIGSLIAGLVVGLGAASELCGHYTRIQWTASPGYCWDGVMVATLAANNPLYAIIATFFVAYIKTSGDVLNASSAVPTQIVDIAQQVVVVMVAAHGLMRGMEKRYIIRNAQKQIDSEKGEEAQEA